MPLQLVRGSETFEPVGAVRALAEGATSTDAWKTQCQALGIADRRLGEPAVGHGTPKIPPMHTTVRAPQVVSPIVVNDVNCYRCKHAIAVNDENRGKTVKCAECGTKQELPR